MEHRYMKKLSMMVVAVTATMSGWCDNDEEIEAGPDLRPIVSIAEKDIENKTDQRANFSALVDRITHELVTCGLYRVMNERDLAAAFKKEESDNIVSGSEQNVNANRAGFLIYLSVAKYGIVANESRSALYGTASSTRYADVEILMRVVALESGRKGEVVRSCAVSSGPVKCALAASSNSITSGNSDEQALQEACRIVAKKMVGELIRLTKFEVLDVDNTGIMVDIPGSCAKKGDLLSVYRLGRKVKSRRTGKVTQKLINVATLTVTELDEESCTAQVISAAEKVEVGQVVRFSDGDRVSLPSKKVTIPARSVSPPKGSAAAPF